MMFIKAGDSTIDIQTIFISFLLILTLEQVGIFVTETD